MVAVPGMVGRGKPYRWLVENVAHRRRDDGCWLDRPWKASRGTGGYPVATGPNHRQVPAAHLVLQLTDRPRPGEDFVAMHSCDTPQCLNPDHLSWGTQPDNIEDMKAKGRSRNDGGFRSRGEGRPLAKLTDDRVREIRRRAAAGESRRALAAAFGVAAPTVTNIVNRKAWAHVD